MNKTGEEKIAKLLEYISNGKTVYITTMTRCTKITAKDVAKFAKAGVALFKAKGNSMFIASGRNYLCIDYCSITIA